MEADAAPAYNDVFAQHPEIVEVGSWAHARRHFKEAVSSAALPVAQVLAWVGELYSIETLRQAPVCPPSAKSPQISD